MLRRLRIYFTGFGIGLIVVYFMFFRDDSRDLDIWTPSQRVLEEIRADSILQSTDRYAFFVECNGLGDSLLLALWTDAEVESLNPGGNPYRYRVLLEKENVHLEAVLERRTRYTLISLKNLTEPKDCACD